MDLWDSVRDGDRERDPFQDRQIRQIIPYHGGVLPSETPVIQELLHDRQLFGTRVLMAFSDPELRRPPRCGLRNAPRNDRDLDFRPAEHFHSQPILDVETLEFDRVLTGPSAHVNAPVGQHPVHVQYDQPYAARHLGVDIA